MLTYHRALLFLNACLSCSQICLTQLHLVAYRLSSIVLAVLWVSAVKSEDPVGTPAAAAGAAVAAAAAGRIPLGQHLGQELHSKSILGKVMFEVCHLYAHQNQ